MQAYVYKFLPQSDIDFGSSPEQRLPEKTKEFHLQRLKQKIQWREFCEDITARHCKINKRINEGGIFSDLLLARKAT